MKLLRRCAPWFAAFLVPGALVGVLYALGGASLTGCAIGGVAGGVVGLFGALVLELVRSAATPEKEKLEALLEATREVQLAKPPLERRIEHEGTARLHEDIQRDEERVRAQAFCCEAGVRALPGPCPWHSPPRWSDGTTEPRKDEPPERG